MYWFFAVAHERFVDLEHDAFRRRMLWLRENVEDLVRSAIHVAGIRHFGSNFVDDSCVARWMCDRRRTFKRQTQAESPNVLARLQREIRRRSRSARSTEHTADIDKLIRLHIELVGMIANTFSRLF